MQFLSANAPELDPQVVAAHVAAAFGLKGDLRPLYSERDQNFVLRSEAGRGYVVKVMNSAEDAGQIDGQIAALCHIAQTDPGLNVPRVHPTLDGHYRSFIQAGQGHIVFVLDYLEGAIAGDRALAPAELRQIGGLLARLARAMQGFFHPSLNARPLIWDPRQIGHLRPHLPLLSEPLRGLAARAMADFEARSLPRLPKLRAQALHADLHRHNLILSPDATTWGVIDFGDMLHAPVALDLANALCDFSDEASLLTTTEAMLQGYHALAPLQDDDLAALFDLICMRLVSTALIMEYRAAHTPGATDYMAEAGFGALSMLSTLMEMEHGAATGHFRKACGLPSTPTMSASTDQLLDQRKRLMGSRPYLFYSRPLHIQRGEGVWLYDADGRRYLDFYNNVPILGHCHPGVTEAIARQARILNTNTRYLSQDILTYAERLGDLTGGALTAAVFVNSGSEANDVAWRMAKAWTGATGFLCQDFAYHGITDAIIAVSPSTNPTALLAAHVRTIMAPDIYRHPGLTAADFARDATRATDDLAVAGLRPAAVIVDSAFMTNGILEPLPGYVADVFDRVRAAGGLCIADEVQSGFGRMGGHFWGYQHHGVTPDFVTIGKPAGNGHPIGVVLTRPEILDHFVATSAFFSTFGGNNVSAAAGLAVLDAIAGAELVDHASAMGQRFKTGLRALSDRHPLIGCVRATGLATGIELVTDRASKAPAKAETDRLVEQLRDFGLLVGAEGILGNIVKMRPPLAVQADDIDFALAALDQGLTSL
jgi:4-aminobutyrate aminotransferase-like enzyme/Ser/Thr protein kinase RdoA (MazF antagonist)